MNMTERDKKTIRFAAIGIAAYLVLFYGIGLLKGLEKTRADFRRLTLQAQNLHNEIKPYENKILLLETLREKYKMNPGQLSSVSLVGETSAAIQGAAKRAGVKIGPIRESPGRSAAGELGSMRFEGFGPPESLAKLLHHVKSLGYPLILDTMQISVDPKKRGQVKLTIDVVILDYANWKEENA